MDEDLKAKGTEEGESDKEKEPTQTKKIRYAVIGLGYIAQVGILPAFAHARENSELTALVSGDPGKLKALAKRYRVSKTYSYEQYANCLQDGIDAVYIALPNSMHRAYAEGAARAGVHVLCEKPMAVTEQECEAMIDAATKAGTKLMIAYRLHFERGNLSVIQAIRAGKIGEPRIFNSVFSQQVAAGNTRLRTESGGGPLFDIGIYCINAARYLFRAEPHEAFAFSASAKDDRFASVDEMNGALLRFPGDRLASFTCSFGAAENSKYEVIGTQGTLKMDPAYNMAADLRCELRVDGKRHKTTYRKRDQFGPELLYFSKCILENVNPEPDGIEGMEDVRIINALMESAATGKPVEIAPLEKKRRPTIDQEIHKPASSVPPPLVHAQTPSK
jgi:predicted dehydrogenase